MARIKICGLTRLEDALLACELGADALGFVFAERSKRRNDPGDVAEIIKRLPPFVTTVGVFQDQPMEEVSGIMDQCRLDLAQLHGDESPEYSAALGCRVLKAVPMQVEADLARLEAYPEGTPFLLDSVGAEGFGGTGETFDWRLALAAKERGPIVLAGGLTPENVALAVEAVRPWGVDGASGTEASPGVKEPAKLQMFISEARRAAGSSI